jgi:hypothetical protein
VPARKEQTVKLGRLDSTPGDWIAKRSVLSQLLIEGDRLGLGAELAEEDTAEELGVTSWSASAPLRRENDFVAAVGEQPPRDRDLGRVEIAIGQWDQDAQEQPPPD